MEILMITVIVALLLLLVKMVAVPLHRLIYIMIFFIVLSFVLSKYMLPFANELLSVWPNVPYSRPLVFSAVLFAVSDLLKQLLDELEYEALGSMMQLAIRILLLMYWLKELSKLLNELTPILEWIE